MIKIINGLITEKSFNTNTDTWCGYVKIPVNWVELIDHKTANIPHGGITFNQIVKNYEEKTIVWVVLGFDCYHLGDAKKSEGVKKGYKNSRYVNKELKKWTKKIIEEIVIELKKDFTKKEAKLLKKLIDLKRERGVRLKNKVIWKREGNWVVYSVKNRIKTFPLTILKTFKKRKRRCKKNV